MNNSLKTANLVAFCLPLVGFAIWLYFAATGDINEFSNSIGRVALISFVLQLIAILLIF